MELLQNAVDSFDSYEQTSLEIKIVLTDNLLVFMHNGQPSQREIWKGYVILVMETK